MNQETENTIYKWIASDGTGLFAQSWKPTTQARAVVALVHGLGEHSSRYAHWVGYFCEKGIALITMDLRGHGHSGGLKGHTPSYKQLLNDVELLLQNAREMFPGIPVILYGHSMGGNLALNYALDQSPNVTACIITSPWLKLSFDPPKLKLLAGKIIRGILPSFSQPSGLIASYLSRDEQVVSAYMQDPLVHDKISIALFTGVHANGLTAIHKADKLDFPCLLMHGEKDMITSPAGSKEFASGNPGKVTLKIWEGGYHEMHNEPEKKVVFDYLYNWLEPHLS
jgi:alpha-beta hydrolase superfamily lysophospholipase